MNTLKTNACLVMFILLLGGMGGCLDGPEDHQGEWAQSANLKELQESEAGSARRQAAAQALCEEARGPQSEARWLPDGSLACTVRRPAGVKKSQVQL